MEMALNFEEFEITETENVEALSETSNYWFAGLAIGVVIGIVAC